MKLELTLTQLDPNEVLSKQWFTLSDVAGKPTKQLRFTLKYLNFVTQLVINPTFKTAGGFLIEWVHNSTS